MENLLNCDIRNQLGSNACNRIRNSGHIPGVIYGHYFSNYPLEFDAKTLNKVIKDNGENAFINVEINGITYPAMIKEVQRDPVTGEVIHIDLQQIYATEKIHTTVPIVLSGRERLAKDSIIQHQLKKIEIECYPNNVPKFINIDISGLSIGNNLKVADVELGEEISILNDPNEIIASLSIVKDEEQELEESITMENDYQGME